MSNTDTFVLTTKDHTILDVMRERSMGRDAVLYEILERKLSRAIVVFNDDIPANVATLNSRVSYRVDDGPAESRIMAPENMHGPVGLLLPIGHPRALALIGLSEGDSMAIPATDGGTETLTLVEVAYQPEAARRERLGLAQGTVSQRPRYGAGFLRLVHSDDALPRAPAKTRPIPAGGSDDPGPSAA